MTYLLKNSNFGTLKFMKTCLVIRFLGTITFCPSIRFFGEILLNIGSALATHPYLPLLGSPPIHTLASNSCLKQLTSPKIESILLNCLPRPCIGALHIPQVISSFDNTAELTEIDLKKDNYLHQLHADGIVSLDLDFKMQFDTWSTLHSNDLIKSIKVTGIQPMVPMQNRGPLN